MITMRSHSNRCEMRRKWRTICGPFESMKLGACVLARLWKIFGLETDLTGFNDGTLKMQFTWEFFCGRVIDFVSQNNTLLDSPFPTSDHRTKLANVSLLRLSWSTVYSKGISTGTCSTRTVEPKLATILKHIKTIPVNWPSPRQSHLHRMLHNFSRNAIGHRTSKRFSLFMFLTVVVRCIFCPEPNNWIIFLSFLCISCPTRRESAVEREVYKVFYVWVSPGVTVTERKLCK